MMALELSNQITPQKVGVIEQDHKSYRSRNTFDVQVNDTERKWHLTRWKTEPKGIRIVNIVTTIQLLSLKQHFLLSSASSKALLKMTMKSMESSFRTRAFLVL